MEQIISLHLEFLQQVRADQEVMRQLKERKIEILDGFEHNVEMVRQFYQKWYGQMPRKRIVLCGINPGKKGAGKTGIPFIDYRSLSHLMQGVHGKDAEQSAQFVYTIISEMGAEHFFSNVYLTNVWNVNTYLDNFYKASCLNSTGVRYPSV
ncbi:uracil-DNA glycosylase family protein, partial [Ectobacillus ponti]